jgi:hypothetical protein
MTFVAVVFHNLCSEISAALCDFFVNSVVIFFKRNFTTEFTEKSQRVNTEHTI